MGSYISAIEVVAVIEEEDRVKVFANVSDESFLLRGKEIAFSSGSWGMAAYNFTKLADGTLRFDSYDDGNTPKALHALDAICVYPISGKVIPGLKEKLLAYDRLNAGFQALREQNIKDHLNANGITGISLTSPDGSESKPLN